MKIKENVNEQKIQLNANNCYICYPQISYVDVDAENKTKYTWAFS